MKKLFGMVMIVTAVLLLVFGTLNAQVRTGSISGYALDDTGELLPGAVVTVTNQRLGVSRQSITDSTGFYQFLALQAAVYVLTAELEGFSKVSRTNVRVNVAAKVRLNFELKPAAIQEEEVVVTAPAPLIETEKTTIDTVITTEILETIPILGRDFMSAIRILPGVTQNAYGVSISGGRDTQINYNIDGSDNIDIQQGQAYSGGGYGISQGAFQDFDQEAIQELSVATANYGPEYGFGSGGVINVITKSGSNDFHGSLYFDLRNDAFDKDIAYPYEYYYLGGSLGGALIKDKLFYFGTFTPYFSSTGYDVRSSLFSNVPSDLRDKSKTYGGFAKLTWLVNNKNTMNISSNFSTYSFDSYVTLWHIPPDFPEVQYNGGDLSLTVTNTTIFSSSLMLESSFKYGQTSSEIINEPGINPGLIMDFSGPDITATGAYGAENLWKKTKLNWFERINWFVDDFLGVHNISAGFGVRHNSTDDTWEEERTTILLMPGFSVTTLVYPYNLKLSQTYVAGYVGDAWSPTKNFTVNLGVRLGRNSYLTELLFEPRFSISWDFVGDGKTILRMGGNIYRDRINTYVQQLANYPLSTEILDIFGFIIETPEPYRQVVVPDDIKHPTTYELSLGIERELATDFYASANFIYRDYQDQIFFRYTNLIDPATGQRDDPTKGFLRSYSNYGYCKYKGLHLELGKRWGHGYQFMISYSYQVSNGNSSLFTDFSQHQAVIRGETLMKGDVQTADLSGKTSFDKPYAFKMFGSVLLPLDFVLAGVFTYTAGTPYTDYSRETRTFESEYQGLRSMDLMNIDLKMEKNFRIKGIVAKFAIEVFNLTNRKNVLEPVADVSASDYGEPYRIDPSRRVQLGFRIEW